MRIALTTLAAASFCASVVTVQADETAASNANAGVICSKETGFDSRPLVPTKRVATEIYTSIARALYPKTWRKYPTIFVLDEGQKWGVSQAAETSYKTFKDKGGAAMESVTVQAGGGALQMEIDKCSAAVTVSFAR